MGKYAAEYLMTSNINSFIRLMLKNHPNLKLSTVKRRYYDERKKYGKQDQVYQPYQKKKPNMIKMNEFSDMLRLKYKITRVFLERYGFTQPEINWLEDEGHFDKRYD